MAGKSTFMRQNAIIAILAQSGLFVPASYAKIGIVDKIFSRIGSSDDLSSGQSTFMIEMNQTSNILAQSTERSLIVLDKVGRGTSTYDGLSIAWSALEHIHDKIQCRTLFATHYHELTNLEGKLSNIKNYHVSTKEASGRLLFLHKIQPGPADKSYGINVAELAGLPESVVERAKQILQELENSKSDINISEAPKQMPAENKVNKKLLDFVLALDAENMTPRQALEAVYRLKKLMS
jgi:DNA mismatch repair protein MutS